MARLTLADNEDAVPHGTLLDRAGSSYTPKRERSQASKPEISPSNRSLIPSLKVSLPIMGSTSMSERAAVIGARSASFGEAELAQSHNSIATPSHDRFCPCEECERGDFNPNEQPYPSRA